MSYPHDHPAGGHLQDSHLARASLLPDRAVTPATIEDAYVRFIFYCNPALPRSADTQSLREAFRNPPRSGGKLFSPYVIFQLVNKFYDKEIKTWTELTTRLGVEPPDPGKDESTQKIAQYGVRLKKWMNSMHIKAFFEYLMGIPNDYWTRIPDDPDPIALPVRDGIAVEDDMALRALLPHIRPKRGRKRPEEEAETSPVQASQRQRFPPTDAEAPNPWPPRHSEPRSFHGSSNPARPGPAEPGWIPGPAEPLEGLANQGLTSSMGSQPVHAGPSAVGSFWDEPMESLPPSAPSARPKAPNIRRGAKNVSSAWKTSGWDPGSSKTRGRPPINPRPGDELPGPAYSIWPPNVIERPPPIEAHGSETHGPAAEVGPASNYPAQVSPPSESYQPSMGPISTDEEDPLTGYRMSTQVQNPLMEGFRKSPPHDAFPPQTSSTPGQLAPPFPPASDHPQSGMTNATPSSVTESENSIARSLSPHVDPGEGKKVPMWYFERLENRTNIDALMSYFTHVLHSADWIEPSGKIQERAGLAESNAMVNATIEKMYESADSTQAFLLNLAALAGARMLMTSRPRCYRKPVSRETMEYSFNWKYSFGDLVGEFTIVNRIPISMWKKPPSEPGQEGGDASGEAAEALESLSVEEWKVKYRTLMEELEKRDRQILEMQDRVLGSL